MPAMDQDDLLERLWTDAIDAVDPEMTLETSAKGVIEHIDVLLVARLARYEAVFGWCDAFDEEGISVATWLKRTDRHRGWRELVTFDAEHLEVPFRAGRADEPFADAVLAEGRLVAAGVSGTELAAFMEREARAAVAVLRAILSEQTFEPGELDGLHESLLASDPSGHEGRPGSWPRSAKPAETDEKREHGPEPLLELRRSHALALSPDGRRVVAARGGAITDVGSGRELATCQLLPHTVDVSWSPDGRWIVASSAEGAVAQCDGESGARVRVLARQTRGPAPVFSEDGALLYTGDWNNDVIAWDVATGREVARHHVGRGKLSALDRAPDGGLVVLVGDRAEADLLFLSPSLEETGSRVRVTAYVTDVALDPGGGGRAIAHGFRWVARLDLATGALSEQLDVDAWAVAFSPDAHWLAITTRTGFRIGPPTDLAQCVEIPIPDAQRRASFSSDSRRVALGAWKRGEVWELDALLSPVR